MATNFLPLGLTKYFLGLLSSIETVGGTPPPFKSGVGTSEEVVPKGEVGIGCDTGVVGSRVGGKATGSGGGWTGLSLGIRKKLLLSILGFFHTMQEGD